MKLKHHSHGMYRAALLGGSALIAAGIATSAFGQGSVEEIIVTAQKREQKLQDVPISVTAVTQDVLQTNRIDNVADLSAIAPNLTARPSAGGVGIPQFTLRGVVGYGSVPGQDRSVPIYIDGVYLGAPYATIFDLPDLERIEVLKGPQGTLFGRNATAGAINVITRNPSGEFGIHQQLSFGNYDQFRSVTRVDLPRFGKLTASFSYKHDERTGDIKNLDAGQVWDRSGPLTRQGVAVSPRTLGDKDSNSVFATVRLQPSDSIDLVYKFDWAESNDTPNGTAFIGGDPSALNIDLGGGIIFPAGLPLAAALATNPVLVGNAHRPDFVHNGWVVPSYLRVMGHNFTSTFQLSDSVTLKNVFAYRSSFNYAASQISGLGGMVVTKPVADALAALAGFPAGSFDVIIGSPFSVTDSFAQAEARQWSDEVQLNYDSKYLTLTVGALYFHLNTTNGAPTGEGTTTFFAPFPGGVVPPNQGLNLFYNNAKSLAGYAQAEVHVTPKFDLVGGYRLTRDRKTGTAFADASGLPPAPLSYTKTKPTFLLGFNYKPMQDMLLYAKYSTGFVSGGAVGAVAFEPETVRSWEAGVKTDLLNRRLRVNLALFTAAYKNLQQADQGRNIGHPELGTVVVDQGNAEARGFELELTATPLEGLTVNGGLGYTETKFNHVNPLYGTDETFQPTQRPRWTTNLSGQYETKPLWDETRLLFRIDANWRSRAATDGFLPTPALVGPVAYVPAYWLVNGRVALRDIKVGGGDAEIAFWAKNIFNEDTVQFPIAFNPGPRLSPYLVSTDYIQARTFGVDLIYNF